MAGYDEAGEHLARGVELAESLGANRFLPFFRIFLARVDLRQGRDRAKIVAEVDDALAISRKTGFSFLGPWLLATRARASMDEEGAWRALDAGEAALAGDCVGHNYYGFYQDAIDVAARWGAWQRMDAYADALAAYARDEPLPSSDFLVAKARALARHGRGDTGVTAEIADLRAAADAVGWQQTLDAFTDARAA